MPYKDAERGRTAAREYWRRTHDADPRVPAAPFRRWLSVVIAQYGLTITQAASRYGLGDSTLRKILAGKYPSVQLATVDRALSRSNTGLWELYPNL